MGKLYDSLKYYFENTPKDVLESDWQRLKHLNEIGPDVLEYAKTIYEYVLPLGSYDLDASDNLVSYNATPNNLKPYDVNALNNSKNISYPYQVEMGRSFEYCLAA